MAGLSQSQKIAKQQPHEQTREEALVAGSLGLPVTYQPKAGEPTLEGTVQPRVASTDFERALFNPGSRSGDAVPIYGGGTVSAKELDAFQRSLPKELKGLTSAKFAKKGGIDPTRFAALKKELAGVKRGDEFAMRLASMGVGSVKDLASFESGKRKLVYNKATGELLPRQLESRGDRRFSLVPSAGNVLFSTETKKTDFSSFAEFLGAAGLVFGAGAGLSALLGGGAAAAGGGAAGGAATAAGGTGGAAGATGLAGGAAGGTGLTAGAGALYPSGLAFAPTAAPAATIGGGALGSGLTAGAGALIPSGLAFAPSVAAAPTIGGGALGSGLTPSAGALTPTFPGASATIPELAKKAATPGPGSASQITGEKGGGGGDLMASLQQVGQLAKALTPVATLIGGAGAAAGGAPSPGGAGAPQLPPGVVQPLPDIPKPEQVLAQTKPDVIKAARQRRGRASTMLSAGAGVPFESFGGPSTPFFA